MTITDLPHPFTATPTRSPGWSCLGNELLSKEAADKLRTCDDEVLPGKGSGIDGTTGADRGDLSKLPCQFPL